MKVKQRDYTSYLIGIFTRQLVLERCKVFVRDQLVSCTDYF